MSATLDDLTVEQRNALLQFRREAGHRWKSKLISAWSSGLDERLPNAPLLRQIRNNHGPRWLANLSTP